MFTATYTDANNMTHTFADKYAPVVREAVLEAANWDTRESVVVVFGPTGAPHMRIALHSDLSYEFVTL